MRFRTSVSALKDALGTVRPVIPANPSLLAYSGVHLEVTDEALVVTGSDGDVTLSARVKVGDPETGRLLLPPKPLASYLGSLNGSLSINVEVEDGDLLVTPDGLEPYRFRPLAATFPAAPSPGGEPRQVDLSQLSAALAVLKPAVPRDTLAVQLVSTEDDLTLHATDTYRLTRVAMPGAGFGSYTGVVPFTVLERAAKADADAVAVDSKARMLAFRSPTVSVVARQLAIPFPAVDTVLSSMPPDFVEFVPSDLRGALERIASVAEQSAVSVVLDGGEMRLTASTAEVGQGAESVSLSRQSAAPFTVLVRAAFLQDAVASTAASTAALHFSGPLQPLFVRLDGDLDVLNVVMPVRN